MENSKYQVKDLENMDDLPIEAHMKKELQKVV